MDRSDKNDRFPARTEAAPQASATYGIRGIPTMVLFRNGTESARVSGAMPTQQILAWLDGALRP